MHNESKRRKRDCSESEFSDDSHIPENSFNPNRAREKQSGQEESFSEREMKSCIPNEISEIFDSERVDNLKDFIQNCLNDPTIHFTGYVNLGDGNVCDGVFREINGDKYIQISGGDHDDGIELVAVDIGRKKIAIAIAIPSENGLLEVDITSMKEDGCIDLDNTSSHWEGGVLNDIYGLNPCGYGKEYNDDNNVVYEGFMFGDRKVCYGREYRGIRDKNSLVYEGSYCNGVRCGMGTLYTLNGDVEYEGEWIDDRPSNENEITRSVLRADDQLRIPLSTEELVIEERSFNDTMFEYLVFLSLLKCIKKITVENKCFKNVFSFVLDGLEKLEYIKIGGKCCCPITGNSKGVFRIENCPNLRQLDVGNASFLSFRQLVLSNVNNLQSMNLENMSFYAGRKFILDGLEKLECVTIGENCFKVAKSHIDEEGICRITQCPNLHQLKMGHGSFYERFQFEISSVNSLQSIRFGNDCFSYSNNCFIKGKCEGVEDNVLDLPSLQELTFGTFSFRYCNHVVFESMV